MKLHMHPVSTTSRGVVLFIADNKLDVETVVVDLMKGEHYGDEFSALNPSRQVPVLVDGDFVLTECSAILKYLADKNGSPAYPKDLQQRARVNEVMDWFNTGFYREYAYHLIYPQVYPHHVREGEGLNAGTVKWGKDKSAPWLQVLNDHWLGPDNAFVTGDQISIADYMGAAYVTCGDLIGNSFGEYPNIQRWLKTMRSRPAWNQVNEVHNGFAGSMRDKTFTSIGA